MFACQRTERWLCLDVFMQREVSLCDAELFDSEARHCIHGDTRSHNQLFSSLQ